VWRLCLSRVLRRTVLAMVQFTPTTAIVTGAESGIGRATAVALAAAGMDIGITYLSDADGAEATAAEVRSSGRRAVVAQMDVTDLEHCGDVVDKVADELGGVDVFVNDAGTGDNAPFAELTLEQWRHTVATDLDGPFVVIQRAVRRMVAAGRGGRVIGVTSVHEHQPPRRTTLRSTGSAACSRRSPSRSAATASR